MSSRVRKSITTIAVASLVAAGALSAESPSASAAPPGVSTSQSLGLAQVSGADYDALFALGVQVYERVTIRAVPNLYPPGNELVLRRLTTPREGKPGSKRYGFIGQRLPAVFSIPEGGRWVGGRFYRNPGQLGGGLIQPLTPTTLQYPPRTQPLQALYFSTSTIGPLRGAAVVGPYYG